MDQDCSICHKKYDLHEHIPMMLCLQQHLCCLQCIQTMLDTNSGLRKVCPQCRQQLNPKNISKFRKYIACSQALAKKEEALQKSKQQFSKKLQQQYNKTVRLLVLEGKDQDPKKYYDRIKQKAEKLIQAQSYNLATILVQSIIQKYPNLSDQPFVGIGCLQEQQGFSQNKGLTWYKQYYKITNIVAQDLLAYIFMVQPEPNYQEQKKWYQKIIQANPLNYKHIYGFGVSSKNFYQRDIAQTKFLQVIQLNPNFDKSYEMLGFLNIDNLQLSQKYARLCLDRNPNNIFAQYIMVGRQYSDNSQKYIQNLLLIVGRQPQYTKALHKIGSIYYRSQKIQLAIQQYKKCCQINPYYANSFIQMGKCLIELGQIKNGIQILKSVLQKQGITESDKYNCFYAIGMGYMNMEQYYVSIEWFNRSLQVSPKSIQAKNEIAWCYFELSQYGNAVEIYKQFLQLKAQCSWVCGNRPQWMAQISQCYSKLNKFKQENHWLHQWLSLQPDNVQIYDKLADNYYQLKNWQQSLEWSEKCIEKGHNLHYFYPKMIDNLHNKFDYMIALKKIGEYIHNCQLSPQQYDKMLATGQKVMDCLNKRRRLGLNS